MPARTMRRSHAAEDRPLAESVGQRLRAARTRAGLTQAQLAAGRYTKAYVSALENGHTKPSMAAMNFFAARLGIPLERLLADGGPAWTRLEADLRLASGDWTAALDAYTTLIDSASSELTRAECLLGQAEALSRLGRGRDSVRIAAESGEILERHGRRSQAAWATYWQASGLYEMEQGEQATALLERLLDAIAGGLTVEPDLPVRALVALGMVATRDDQPERALGYLERARAQLGDLDERKRAVYLFSLAQSYRELGDLEGAIATGTQSLASFRAADADREAASIENEMALVYLAFGNLDVARTHALAARAYFEAHADDRWLAHVTETQGQIELAAGYADTAVALAMDARRAAEAAGDQKASLDAGLLLGRSLRAMGDLRGAAKVLGETATMAEELGRRGQLQMILGAWSDVLADLGDHRGAYRVSRRALDAGRG